MPVEVSLLLISLFKMKRVTTEIYLSKQCRKLRKQFGSPTVYYVNSKSSEIAENNLSEKENKVPKRSSM